MLLYDMGYWLFYLAKRLRKRFCRMEKLCRKYEYFFILLVNRKIAPWMEKHPVKWGLNTQKRQERYTVSLTSFPARIGYVHLTVETLMRQRFKPDRIILWLAESQFPDKKLPEALTRLESRGLTVRWCEDLRSHKKYHYVFQEFPEDNVILADDDLFYPRDTVARLVKLHKKHPKDIIALSGQIIAPDMAAPPSVWPVPEAGKRYVSCREAQAFTGAGSLFPAGWHIPEVFNKDKAMAMAATADDLWLKAMALTAGVNTTLDHPARGFPVEVWIENNVTLFQVNGNQGGNVNDSVWQTLLEEYKLDKL